MTFAFSHFQFNSPRMSTVWRDPLSLTLAFWNATPYDHMVNFADVDRDIQLMDESRQKWAREYISLQNRHICCQWVSFKWAQGRDDKYHGFFCETTMVFWVFRFFWVDTRFFGFFRLFRFFAKKFLIAKILLKIESLLLFKLFNFSIKFSH